MSQWKESLANVAKKFRASPAWAGARGDGRTGISLTATAGVSASSQREIVAPLTYSKTLDSISSVDC